MRTVPKAVVVVMGALAPAVTFAHPGHGFGEGWSMLHYLTEPAHLFVSVLGILAVVLGSAILVRRRRPCPARR